MSGLVPKLFHPIRVGEVTLSHRVVLAPLTRQRANTAHVHGDLAVEYYSQRASVPGSLLISEGTLIAAQAGGMPHVPGIWNDEQVAAWRRVTDAVHAKGSFIFMQLWAVGRAATVSELRKENPNFPYVGPSDIKLSGRSETPRPLTVTEIKEYVQLYATAASNAVHRAGFDGVEFHGANGYLVDQFLQDVSNNRTDEYGGSVENRSRFALEALEAISKVVGQSRTAVRLSPWGEFQDMRMADATIFSTYTHFITRLSELYPNLAYVHVIEPDAQGHAGRSPRKAESNEFIHKIWAPRPIISAGGYSRESALKVAEETGQLIAFGRAYIPNPDLPLRLRKNLPLTATDRSVFYVFESPKGYIDYPFAEDSEDIGKSAARATL